MSKPTYEELVRVIEDLDRTLPRGVQFYLDLSPELLDALVSLRNIANSLGAKEDK